MSSPRSNIVTTTTLMRMGAAGEVACPARECEQTMDSTRAGIDHLANCTRSLRSLQIQIDVLAPIDSRILA